VVSISHPAGAAQREPHLTLLSSRHGEVLPRRMQQAHREAARPGEAGARLLFLYVMFCEMPALVLCLGCGPALA
jgi:hypothetical protein